MAHVFPQEVLFLYQLTGVFPVIYTAKTSKRDQNIIFSLKCFICGLIVVAFQTVSSYLALYLDYTHNLIGKPIRMFTKTAVIANLTDVIALNLMVVTVFASSTGRYNKFIDMCRTLDRVDQILKQNIYESKRKLKVFLIANHVLVLVSFSIWYEFGNYLSTHDDILYVIYIPSYSFAYLIVIGLVIHFTFVARSIAKRFNIVNNKLKQEVMNSFNTGRKVHTCCADVGDTSSSISSTSRIKELMDTYWLLCDAVVEANAFYCYQMLCVIPTLFLQIIISGYYLFRDIWPEVQPGVMTHVLMQIDWCFAHSFNLILIVWSSTGVTNAADETGLLVCDLMNQALSTDLTELLESFIRQIPHHNAKFSALGFFQLNNYILTAIAGSVTTFLVIFIQFHTSTWNYN